MKRRIEQLMMFLIGSLCLFGAVESTAQATCVDVQLAAFLEGPYDTGAGEMNNLLNLLTGDPLHRGVLPGQRPFNFGLPGVSSTPSGQPYGVAPWNYGGLEGSFDAAPWYFASDSTGFAVYHEDVVDWVLVRFRSGTLPNLVTEAEAAGLLLKDGSIQFLDACVLEYDPLVGSPDLYVQIDHRNHAAVLSPMPFDISTGELIWDFRANQSYRANLGFGQKEITAGVFVMFTGDMEQAGDLGGYSTDGLDKIVWSQENGLFDEYRVGDLNMNGDTAGQDLILFSSNNGISVNVPK